MNGGIEESADEGVRAGQARIGLPAGQVSDDLSDAGVATPEQSEDLNAQSVPAPGAGHLTRAQVDGVVEGDGRPGSLVCAMGTVPPAGGNQPLEEGCE